MKRPLTPLELYPAGHSDISTHFISLSTGVRVRVAESGPPDGVPVIMLHGWGASLYMFRHALALLPSNGVRVIAIDLRGYGLSDKPMERGAYTLDAFCSDLDALLDALGLSRVALMGQSMGGGLALRYALRRPERVTRIVLVNPTGLVPVAPLAVLRSVPRAVIRSLGRHVVPRWVVRFILQRLAYGDAALVRERDIDEYWAPTQLDGYASAVHATLREFDWQPVSATEAASLSMPSTVILGTRDRLVRHADTAAAQLRGSLVYRVVGGHCVHEEQPGEVYGGIVGPFLREE